MISADVTGISIPQGIVKSISHKEILLWRSGPGLICEPYIEINVRRRRQLTYYYFTPKATIRGISPELVRSFSCYNYNDYDGTGVSKTDIDITGQDTVSGYTEVFPEIIGMSTTEFAFSAELVYVDLNGQQYTLTTATTSSGTKSAQG